MRKYVNFTRIRRDKQWKELPSIKKQCSPYKQKKPRKRFLGFWIKNKESRYIEQERGNEKKKGPQRNCVLFPSLFELYICNFISAFGHSMNGQAFSKTSESTSMIALKESDLKKAMQSNRFTLKFK